MASAGKVSPITRGNWSGTESYTRLDIVSSGGSSYIAKKDSVNVPVSNTEYWQLMAQGGVSSADNISYDNATSGLTGTNVQSAIDEMVEKVESTASKEYVDAFAKSMEYDEDTSMLSLKDANGDTLSEVKIEGGGGGSGSTINGLTKEASLFGKEATLSYNGSVIKRTTISALGSFSFTGVQPLGVLTVSATDGTDTAETTVNATQWSYYECTLSLYSLYGYHINPNESDPDARVTYLSDCKNASYTPAFMNFATSTFEYGDWTEDEFFMPKSCMLKYDGTVDYYLNENDNTKKLDGTASDVANTSYGGNAMMEWGRDGKRIYWKIVPDSNADGGKVYICDKQLDSGFKDFNFRDANGKLIDHFYTPKYNGSLVDGKLRSLSGQSLIKSYTATQEVNYALANNPSGKQMWYIEQWVDRMLINLLLVLMCKSTNTQEKFGYGNIYYNPTSEAAMINTGTMNDKGMFFGKKSSTTHDGVKVFGMENYWGNQWRRTAGYINDNGTQKVKMTWGTNDGSTTTGYNETGSGYLTVSGATPAGTSGGYISKAKFDPITGITPYYSSGSETTYYADGLWFNNSRVNFAIVGGGVNAAFLCGAFCASLDDAPSGASWIVGVSVSCKPLG